MAQIEGGHVDDRVGAVPGPDSVNRRVTGPGTEPGSVPGLVRLKWAMCKRGYIRIYICINRFYNINKQHLMNTVTSQAFNFTVHANSLKC